MSNCSKSEECTIEGPGGRDVFRTCYESITFTDLKNFCGCNEYYGWKGDFCNEISSQLILFRILSIFRCLVSFSIFLYALFQLKQLFLLDLNNNSNNNNKVKFGFNIKQRCFKILFFCMGNIIFSFIYSILTLFFSFRFDLFEIYTYKFIFNNNATTSNPSLNVYIDISATLIIIFSLISSLQISISWIETIEKYDLILNNLKYKTILKIYKNIVFFLSILLSPLSIISVFLGYIIPGYLSAILISFLLVLLFIIGRYSLIKQLKVITNIENTITLKLITKSTKIHLILLTISVFIFISLTLIIRVSFLPGTFSPSTFIFNILILSLNVLIISHLWYISQITKVYKQKDLTTISLIELTHQGF